MPWLELVPDVSFTDDSMRPGLCRDLSPEHPAGPDRRAAAPAAEAASVLVLRDVLRWKVAEGRRRSTPRRQPSSILQRAHAQPAKSNLTEDSVVDRTRPSCAPARSLGRRALGEGHRDVRVDVQRGRGAGDAAVLGLIPGPERSAGSSTASAWARPRHALGSDERERSAAFRPPPALPDGMFGLPICRCSRSGARASATRLRLRRGLSHGPACGRGCRLTVPDDDVMAGTGRCGSRCHHWPTLSSCSSVPCRTRGSRPGVVPASLGARTPCSSWDLAQLLVHLDDSLRTLQAAADVGKVTMTPVAPDHADHPVVSLKWRAGALLGAWSANDGAELVSVAGSPLAARTLVAAGALRSPCTGGMWHGRAVASYRSRGRLPRCCCRSCRTWSLSWTVARASPRPWSSRPGPLRGTGWSLRSAAIPGTRPPADPPDTPCLPFRAGCTPETGDRRCLVRGRVAGGRRSGIAPRVPPGSSAGSADQAEPAGRSP